MSGRRVHHVMQVANQAIEDRSYVRRQNRSRNRLQNRLKNRLQSRLHNRLRNRLYINSLTFGGFGVP